MRSIMLVLAVAVLAFAESPRYIFVGTYELGDVLSALCQDTGCKLGLSGDVVKLPITLSVTTSKASALLSAVRNSLLSSGYYLTGTPKGFVSVTNDASREMFYFVDCRNAVQIVPKEHRQVYLRADSLQCIEKPLEPPLATANYTLQYFAFDNSVLDNWGIDWTKVLSTGDFFSKPQIPLSWSIRALGENDSLVQFRSLQFSLDSALRIVWGNETQESLKSYAENGVVTTSYEWRDYGLTIDLKRTKEKVSLDYSFISNDNAHNKLSGHSSASRGDTLLVVGAYQDLDKIIFYVPFLGRLPLIGHLFSYREEKSVYRFFVLRLIPNFI